MTPPPSSPPSTNTTYDFLPAAIRPFFRPAGAGRGDGEALAAERDFAGDVGGGGGEEGGGGDMGSEGNFCGVWDRDERATIGIPSRI
jgi:hypothetical protein